MISKSIQDPMDHPLLGHALDVQS